MALLVQIYLAASGLIKKLTNSQVSAYTIYHTAEVVKEPIRIPRQAGANKEILL